MKQTIVTSKYKGESVQILNFTELLLERSTALKTEKIDYKAY